MRILLIDDEIVALNALKKRVDWVKYGFTDVLTALDAESAKQILEKYAVDLMLCDIEMPGVSGLELAEYAKKKYPSTDCIMVTCHAEFGYIKQAMRYKVSDYILKPIDYEELEGLLASFQKEKEKEQQQLRLEKYISKGHPVSKMPYTEDNCIRMEIVKNYIEEHLHEKIYVADLAELVHINDQHLMRIFKRETGQSLTEYIAQRRIAIASSLLKETDHSIQFIADCIGCENYSYFTKLFKKYTGFTPREYRVQFKKA